MASLNKVLIIGRVGRDPEQRYTQGGKAMTSFSVAVSRKFGDKDETEWFNVVCWDKLAEQMNTMITKGRLVYVEGRLQTRQWDDQGGQKHSRTEVVAGVVTMLDKAPINAATTPDEEEISF